MEPATTEPVLELEGLTKRYKGGLLALDDVSLTIRRGEIFALLGPNGAGKTTLIGAVCGLVKRTSGVVRLFGTDLASDPITPRFDVGLVPQEINFDPFFTVEETLRYHLGYYGRPKDEARIQEVLEALALAPKAKSRARALSGGMKRRLLIAKALIHRPKLVFLDEPTAGVDVELRRDLWTYVRKLNEEGTTVVLTTHYLEEAEELSHRVGIIDGGKLLLTEDTRALMDRLGERQLTVRLRTALPQLPEYCAAAGASLEEGGKLIRYREVPGGARPSTLLAELFANADVEEVETHRSRLEDVLLRVLHKEAA